MKPVLCGASWRKTRCRTAPARHRHICAIATYISTRELVTALLDAGFAATEARQTCAHGERAAYTRHLLRFRSLRTEVALEEAIPEIVVINAHDGTSAYQVRAGLFRPVCTNGLLTKLGDFGAIYVPHRGNVVANIVEAAQQMLAQFAPIAIVVKAMAATLLSDQAQLELADQAVAIRATRSMPRR